MEVKDLSFEGFAALVRGESPRPPGAQPSSGVLARGGRSLGAAPATQTDLVPRLRAALRTELANRQRLEQALAETAAERDGLKTENEGLRASLATARESVKAVWRNKGGAVPALPAAPGEVETVEGEVIDPFSGDDEGDDL